jgi:hypothetical protein
VTFRRAVESTTGLEGAFRPGLQALRATDSTKIQCRDTRSLTGSVDIDGALRQRHPQATRWDYGIGKKNGASEHVVWVEVHPASHSGVSDMLAKVRWLEQWLQTEAPNLELINSRCYYWVSTDARISITEHSTQGRQLAAAGIRRPVRRLEL